MKPYEIENWALRIIELIESGQPIEDFRVELKSDWPDDPRKAARQIAGHANAAHGEPILWLIGIDEKKGVIGASKNEKENWYPKVQAQFDGLAPSVIDINIPVQGIVIIALLFGTERTPFVVKNPSYGSSNGGPVEFEVPWRDNTSTRSARRSDLIKLLSPLQKLPSFELLKGCLTVNYEEDKGTRERNLLWFLKLDLYIYPNNQSQIVIPFHQCDASFEISEILPRTFFDWLNLEPESTFRSFDIGLESKSFTIKGTSTEVLIDGPGRLLFTAQAKTQVVAERFTNPVKIFLNFLPAHSERSVPVSTELKYSTPIGSELSRWIF